MITVTRNILCCLAFGALLIPNEAVGEGGNTGEKGKGNTGGKGDAGGKGDTSGKGPPSLRGPQGSPADTRSPPNSPSGRAMPNPFGGHTGTPFSPIRSPGGGSSPVAEITRAPALGCGGETTAAIGGGMAGLLPMAP